MAFGYRPSVAHLLGPHFFDGRGRCSDPMGFPMGFPDRIRVGPPGLTVARGIVWLVATQRFFIFTPKIGGRFPIGVETTNKLLFFDQSTGDFFGTVMVQARERFFVF